MNAATHLLFIAVFLLSHFVARSAQNVVAPEMAGDWRGSAHIIVKWVQQTNMPVALAIKTDGTVTGRIGDATLREGHFKRNRGTLGRALHLKTDYIITGKLEGPMLAKEKITRTAVSIPLNHTNGTLVGGLHSSGAKLGRHPHGVLSARVVLGRASNR